MAIAVIVVVAWCAAGAGAAPALAVTRANVAVVAVRAKSLPPGNLFSDFHHWYGSEWSTEFAVKPSVSGTVVEFGYDEWFETNTVTLILTREGAHARMVYSSDVGRREGVVDVGGCAWLFTDGVSAVLELELYEISDSGGIRPVFARVQLGSAAVDLAADLLGREVGMLDTPPQLQRFAGQPADFNQCYAEGYVDSLGRRQGVWTVSKGDRKVVEVGWKKGIVDGCVASYRDDQSLTRTVEYASGYPDGADSIWAPDGKQVAIGYWRNGLPMNEYVQFHPNGTKSCEVRMGDSGRVETRWGPSGELISVRPAKDADSSPMEREWASLVRAHREELEAIRSARDRVF